MAGCQIIVGWNFSASSWEIFLLILGLGGCFIVVSEFGEGVPPIFQVFASSEWCSLYSSGYFYMPASLIRT